MGTKTIHQLNLITTLANDDKVAAWDASAAATKAITVANLKTVINSAIDFSPYLTTDGITPGATSGIQSFVSGILVGLLRVGSANSPIDSSSIFNGGFEIGVITEADYRGLVEAGSNSLSIHSNQYYDSGWSVFDTNKAPASIVLTSSNGDSYIEFKTKASNTGQATTRVKIDKNGSLLAGHDTDTTHYLGRAAIGYNGASADSAIFAHVDRATAASAALTQGANGATILNTASGTTLALAVAGSTKCLLSASAFYPLLDNTIDIGLSGTHFANVYTKTIRASSPNTISVMVGTQTIVQFVGPDNEFKPGADNATYCGTAARRWISVHAVNGTIQTSDEREKEAIAPTPLGLDFIRRLKPVRYRWRDSSDSRHHYGLIAQDVQETLREHGEDQFGGHNWDEKSDRHGLNYSEFIAPIIKAIQELAADVETLKQR